MMGPYTYCIAATFAQCYVTKYLSLSTNSLIIILNEHYSVACTHLKLCKSIVGLVGGCQVFTLTGPL